MAKYGIKITYSNGDEEDGLYGNFASKEEAFKEICVLAVKEAYVQNEDFDELVEATSATKILYWE